ncbi:MAG: Xaa-Pro peptidase family protein [Pseudomonadota bacterium]
MQFRPNLPALQALINSKKLDALVCMSPENFTYVAGAYITTIKTIRPRHAYAILTKKGEAHAIVCAIEESLVRNEGWIGDLHAYIEFRDDPVIVLAEALKRMDLAEGVLGFDLGYIPAASLHQLKTLLPQLQLVDTTELVAAVRAIKSADEISVLENTTRQTHRAVVEGLANSKIGDTDRTIANRIIKQMFDLGANGVQHLHLASGKRTPFVHNHPSDDPTCDGEILRLDVGGTYGPFASDLARTYSTGSPTSTHREVYRALCDVQERTIAAMRPGVLAEDLYFLCREAFAAHGLPCTLPHIGHSFGIEAHESPMIRPGEKTLLRAGMVINIEPMTKDADGNLYHTEDLVLVTEGGFRLLTYGLAPKEIPIMGQPLSLH